MPADSANIARHLPLMAERQPGRPAVKISRGRTAGGDIDYAALTFAELDAEVDSWCARLAASGVRRGDRALVMVRQGLPLIATAFALFKLGAVPVVIDPGMGLRNFLACVARSRPRVLLGLPFAQLLGRLCRQAFIGVQTRIWVSGSATARLSRPARIADRKPEIVDSSPSDLAAILFTSGSTGAPKGVCYEHGMFDAQARLIRNAYGIEPGEVDLPMLPLFALFNPALGMTTIVPEIDPAHPAAADPAKIAQAIRQENVTNSFGSPTLWRKVFDHCLGRGITFPSLRRVLCAGAAAPASLWTDAPRILTGGKLHSPYGATEALPVSTVSADEVDPGSVKGAPVGRPFPENQVKIAAIADGPIATLADARELPAGEIGEIIVTGPTVTKHYDQLPEATKLAKIQASNPKPQGCADTSVSLETWNLKPGTSMPVVAGAVWHRMGDAGYLDAGGCLWFCGRVAERVETANGALFTEPCERVFLGHPCVARCALVGLGPRGCQEPALVVQPVKTLAGADENRLAGELRGLALRHPHTAGIRRFFFRSNFPVDARHNAKIHRLALARWAATRNGIAFRE